MSHQQRKRAVAHPPTGDTTGSKGKPTHTTEQREEIFCALGRRLGEAKTFRQVAEILLKVADELMGWDSSGLSLYSAKLDATTSVLAMDIINGKRVEVSGNTIGSKPTPRFRQIIDQGAQLLLRQNLEIDLSATLMGDVARPSASLIYVPVLFRDQVIGILTIQSYTFQAYTKADLNTLQALADYGGEVIYRLQVESRCHLLFEQAIEGVCQMTPAGRLLTANPALARMLGYDSVKELLANVSDISQQLFVQPDAPVPFHQQLERQGLVQDFETEFQRKNGDPMWVSLNAQMVRNDGGASSYYEVSVGDISEHKRSEAALRRTEEMYRRAISGVGAVPYIYDYKSRSYLFMGDGIESLVGYKSSEINTDLWNRITQETFMAGDAAGFDKAEAARRVLTGELNYWRCDMRVLTREGKTRWISDVSLQNRDENGKATGSMGILEDITERKQAEISAGIFSRLSQSLVSAASPSDVARHLSKAADELFGWDALSFFLFLPVPPGMEPVLYMDTVEGRRVEVPPPHVEGHFDYKPTVSDERVRKHGAELVLRTPESLVMPAESLPYGDKARPSASIMRVPIRLGQEVTGIVAMHSYRFQAYTKKDLSTFQSLADASSGALERIRSEQALRQSESHLRLLWESGSDGIRLCDGEGIMHQVNEAYCRMVQKTRAELEGQPLTVIHKDANAKFVLDSYRHRMDTKSVVPYLETEVVLWNGRKAWFGLSNSLLELPGKPPLLLSVFRDITQRKEAETELDRMHRQLLEASRQAGMAEVATSVLHNVGNVLNSVNISNSLITEKMRNSKVANLSKAVALMQAHATDLAAFLTQDPKGSQLPGYFASLAKHLDEEQKEILNELKSLGANIDHIKEIVAMQQSYAMVAGVRESLPVVNLVEDALRLNAGAMERHQVHVIREYSELPPILVDKHKVLQILVNLMRNAKYALDDKGHTDKRMILRVGTGTANTMRISVIDNGIGIPAANLTRIFEHGFTTRKEGHGFGLHNGALAAKELGGSLTVHSDGPGTGAAFTLELPYGTTAPS